MSVLTYISAYIIPVTILFIILFGCLQKVKLYETFLAGARDGLQAVVEIVPTLIGLLLAVEVFRAGGLLDVITETVRPLAEFMFFPAELVPISIVRLVSSSAAMGLLVDIFRNFGPDSFLGRTASVMMSCTETVFYTMSLYFLSVGIRGTRYTLFCALTANFVGVGVAVILVRMVFGG